MEIFYALASAVCAGAAVFSSKYFVVAKVEGAIATAIFTGFAVFCGLASIGIAS
jgi:hypothetical protein